MGKHVTNLLDKKCHKTNVFIENESLDCRYYYPKVFFSLSRHEKKKMNVITLKEALEHQPKKKKMTAGK
jgi:hypothetical protein